MLVGQRRGKVSRGSRAHHEHQFGALCPVAPFPRFALGVSKSCGVSDAGCAGGAEGEEEVRRRIRCLTVGTRRPSACEWRSVCCQPLCQGTQEQQERQPRVIRGGTHSHRSDSENCQALQHPPPSVPLSSARWTSNFMLHALEQWEHKHTRLPSFCENFVHKISLVLANVVQVPVQTSVCRDECMNACRNQSEPENGLRT